MKLPPDRRKYRCPCGNPFSTAQIESTEKRFAEQKALNVHLPARLPHSCGRCGRLSVLEAGAMRYMTPDEELRYRCEFPAAARAQDYAIKNDLPDCIAAIPLEGP